MAPNTTVIERNIFSGFLETLKLIVECKSSEFTTDTTRCVGTYKASLQATHIQGDDGASPQTGPKSEMRNAEVEDIADNYRSAYEWLLENVHNPYPSLGVKLDLAKKSGISSQAVGTWFTNARRRMGWNRIAKQHFNGNQAAILHFAHRVFVEGTEDPKRRVTQDFIEMKANIEKTYRGKYQESELSKRIRALHSRPLDNHNQSRQANRDSRMSPSCHDISSLKDTSPLHKPQRASSISTHKRKRENPEIVHSSGKLHVISEDSSRAPPAKRSRLLSDSPGCSYMSPCPIDNTLVPTPGPELPPISTLPEKYITSAQSQIPSSTMLPLQLRKRRFSDSQPTDLLYPQYPQGVASFPKRQVVSDSFAQTLANLPACTTPLDLNDLSDSLRNTPTSSLGGPVTNSSNDLMLDLWIDQGDNQDLGCEQPVVKPSLQNFNEAFTPYDFFDNLSFEPLSLSLTEDFYQASETLQRTPPLELADLFALDIARFSNSSTPTSSQDSGTEHCISPYNPFSINHSATSLTKSITQTAIQECETHGLNDMC